jgi:hypothetical protein
MGEGTQSRPFLLFTKHVFKISRLFLNPAILNLANEDTSLN